jgi:hypothetical protein
MNSQLIRAGSEPNAATLLREDGMVIEPLNVVEFGAFVDAKMTRWRPMIEKAGFVVQ